MIEQNKKEFEAFEKEIEKKIFLVCYPNREMRTGFFCEIPVPKKEKKATVLITSYSNLSDEEIEEGVEIEIFSSTDKDKGKKILKDHCQIIFNDEFYNTTMIEIFKDTDIINNIKFFEYSEEYDYSTKSVFLVDFSSDKKLIYPIGLILKKDEGKMGEDDDIENKIEYFCFNKDKSFGGPILLKEEEEKKEEEKKEEEKKEEEKKENEKKEENGKIKVIGIHYGNNNKEGKYWNSGINILNIIHSYYGKNGWRFISKKKKGKQNNKNQASTNNQNDNFNIQEMKSNPQMQNPIQNNMNSLQMTCNNYSQNFNYLSNNQMLLNQNTENMQNSNYMNYQPNNLNYPQNNMNQDQNNMNYPQNNNNMDYSQTNYSLNYSQNNINYPQNNMNYPQNNMNYSQNDMNQVQNNMNYPHNNMNQDQNINNPNYNNSMGQNQNIGQFNHVGVNINIHNQIPQNQNPNTIINSMPNQNNINNMPSNYDNMNISNLNTNNNYNPINNNVNIIADPKMIPGQNNMDSNINLISNQNNDFNNISNTKNINSIHNNIINEKTNQLDNDNKNELDQINPTSNNIIINNNTNAESIKQNDNNCSQNDIIDNTKKENLNKSNEIKTEIIAETGNNNNNNLMNGNNINNKSDDNNNNKPINNIEKNASNKNENEDTKLNDNKINENKTNNNIKEFKDIYSNIDGEKINIIFTMPNKDKKGLKIPSNFTNKEIYFTAYNLCKYQKEEYDYLLKLYYNGNLLNNNDSIKKLDNNDEIEIKQDSIKSCLDFSDLIKGSTSQIKRSFSFLDIHVELPNDITITEIIDHINSIYNNFLDPNRVKCELYFKGKILEKKNKEIKEVNRFKKVKAKDDINITIKIKNKVSLHEKPGRIFNVKILDNIKNKQISEISFGTLEKIKDFYEDLKKELNKKNFKNYNFSFIKDSQKLDLNESDERTFFSINVKNDFDCILTSFEKRKSHIFGK